jgi:hypothetical protein
MDAAGKSVTPTTPLDIKHVAQTITTHCCVLCRHRRRAPATAIENKKLFGNGNRLTHVRLDGINSRQRRRILMQPLNQSLNALRLPAGLDFHAMSIISHPSGQFQLFGQAQGKRAQTNALHNPAKPDALANNA